MNTYIKKYTFIVQQKDTTTREGLGRIIESWELKTTLLRSPKERERERESEGNNKSVQMKHRKLKNVIVNTTSNLTNFRITCHTHHPTNQPTSQPKYLFYFGLAFGLHFFSYFFFVYFELNRGLENESKSPRTEQCVVA